MYEKIQCMISFYNCVENETNSFKKYNYCMDICESYNSTYSVEDASISETERKFAKELRSKAYIQSLIINARNEKNEQKRIAEYEKCIRELEQIAEAEDDEKLKEHWTSTIHYLKGRQFVNKAGIEPSNRELMEKAIELFKSAKDRCPQANRGYYICTVLFELEKIEVLDNDAMLRMKKLMGHAVKNIPKKVDNDVKLILRVIEVLFENINLEKDNKMLLILDPYRRKIKSKALNNYLTYSISKILENHEKPFRPKVTYSNWTLNIKFDEPEKVQGNLTIKVGDDEIYNKIPENPNLIHIKHISEIETETLTFTDEKGRSLQEKITYSEHIKYSKGFADVHFLGHDCKRPNTYGKLKIAIVQLKYHLKREGLALVIVDNEAYKKKVKKILNAVKKDADIVVFPEFSIPFGYLKAMTEYSKDNSIVIVAGSHYIIDDNLDEYGGMFYDEFGDKDLLKNISPIIIPSQKKILHTEKVFSSKEERAMFFKEGMRHGTLNRIFKLNNDVTFGAMICFDFMNDELRTRIMDECNVILVPQTNPGIEKFHQIGKNEIDNPRSAGNKAFIMANGIFTYNDDKNVMGGYSGIILTLDKDSNEKYGHPIIESVEVDGSRVHEQFIMLAELNTDFFSARETQDEQAAINYRLIHIFEENEILKSAEDGKKDDRNPQAFLELLKTINSCDDRHELEQLLADNGELIRKHSPLMYRNTRTLGNLKADEIKEKCASIVLN